MLKKLQLKFNSINFLMPFPNLGFLIGLLGSGTGLILDFHNLFASKRYIYLYIFLYILGRRILLLLDNIKKYMHCDNLLCDNDYVKYNDYYKHYAPCNHSHKADERQCVHFLSLSSKSRRILPGMLLFRCK